MSKREPFQNANEHVLLTPFRLIAKNRSIVFLARSFVIQLAPLLVTPYSQLYY